MRNDRGYTYLITNGTHYKIGITTKTPVSRIAELQTGSPTKISISGYCYNSNALEMEKTLHKKFAEKRLSGEWFALDEDDVAMIHRHFETNYLDEYFAPLSDKGRELKRREDESKTKHLKTIEELITKYAEMQVIHWNFLVENDTDIAQNRDKDWVKQCLTLEYHISDVPALLDKYDISEITLEDMRDLINDQEEINKEEQDKLKEK